MEKKTVVNLISESDDKNIIVSPRGNGELYLPYFKEESHFVNNIEYIKFIRGVESLIRRSKEYKAYISYLKNTVGLKRCMVFGNIDDEKAPVEMHHGPIFTLFDYVELCTVATFRDKKQSVSSFRIADYVLQDHFDNLIQVVMLCEAAHEAVHPDPNKKDVKPEFVNIDSAWGDLIGYINKYGSYFNYSHVHRIKRYMKEYTEHKEAPGERFTVFKEAMKKWNPGEFK